MTFDVPGDLRYQDSHEWVRFEGEAATVGITDFAQDELGDVVFVDLPTVGDSLERGEQFGVVESIKATSDLYLPVAGEVLAVNGELQSSPELVNDDPYGDGWMLRVAVGRPGETADLLTDEEYRERTS